MMPKSGPRDRIVYPIDKLMIYSYMIMTYIVCVQKFQCKIEGIRKKTVPCISKVEIDSSMCNLSCKRLFVTTNKKRVVAIIISLQDTFNLFNAKTA